MDTGSRHQCLIYDGSPSKHLASLAQVARQNLSNNFRCLYLNSPPMVAGMRSYLAAAGVDVERETAQSNLVLSAEQGHLEDGVFSVDRMIRTLEQEVERALRDGYQGLWATGDMTWEFGPQQDFDLLLEYEWRLEGVFRKRPELCGICQYHRDVLPAKAAQHALISHPSIFVNETLSRLNPHYVNAKKLWDRRMVDTTEINPELIARLTTEGNAS